MEFGSEWAYLKHGEDIESVEEEESSSDEDIPVAPIRLSASQKRRVRGAAAAAPKPKEKKKKWRLQPKGEDDGKVMMSKKSRPKVTPAVILIRRTVNFGTMKSRLTIDYVCL